MSSNVVTLMPQDFWAADDQALFNRKQIAGVLRCSVSWLEQLATRGDGPLMLKFGRRVLYRKRDVLDWIASRAKVVAHTSALAV